MTSRDSTVFAVVTGGGTSGHVVPAIAIIEQLQDAGIPASRLRYVGSRRGVERRLMADVGVEAEYLPISGLQRGIAPRAIARNLALPVRLLRSVVAARSLLKRWKPQVVISVGGYASEPMSRAAVSAGVPLVCVSYDRVAGLATRIQARHATTCAVAFVDTDLPNKIVTGAPVRRELRTLDVAERRDAARRVLDIPPDALLVSVVGGSLGSGVLNSAVQGLLDALGASMPGRAALYHLCGTRNTDDSLADGHGTVWYRRAGYDDRMSEIYAASDLVVCRAGASTVAEVAAVGVAAAIVPWSGAADDHQALNAAWLADEGGAVMVTEEQVSDGVLADRVVSLLSDRDQRVELSRTARRIGATSRSDALARAILRASTSGMQVSLVGRRRIHVVGVAGPGMSAIAIVLAQMGHDVSGSDIRDSDTLRSVRDAGVRVSIGHAIDNVDEVEIVTYSTGVPLSNLEMVEARNRNIPVVHRSVMLDAICRCAPAYAVAGTHGKTTTSALLTSILEHAGKQPSFVIGATVDAFGVGARWSDGAPLVVEADESDGTHDALRLNGSIVTNIDKDHLDHFGTMEDMVGSFAHYVERLSGPAVMCLDDPNCAKVIETVSKKSKVITYGTLPECDVRVQDCRTIGEGITFDVVGHDDRARVALPLFGLHNALNCAAAMVMAREMGVPFEVSAGAVSVFGGVERRYEDRGRFNDAVLIDDYAHVPNEIAAVLNATRQRFGDASRIIAVFQPNRFHRIAEMHADFADCFGDADVVVVTDVYASGTPRIEGVTGRLIVDDIVAAHPDSTVVWAPRRDDIVSYLRQELRSGDVCVGMGCGDIETLADDLRGYAS